MNNTISSVTYWSEERSDCHNNSESRRHCKLLDLLSPSKILAHSGLRSSDTTLGSSLTPQIVVALSLGVSRLVHETQRNLAIVHRGHTPAHSHRPFYHIIRYKLLEHIQLFAMHRHSQLQCLRPQLQRLVQPVLRATVHDRIVR